VRIHEGSLPKLYIDRVGDLRSAASLITETILSDLRHKLLKLVAISPGTLEVGNTLAVKQYLIAPLSRLKEGGTVAYLKKPEDLN